MVDIHSHILWGLDDGAKSLEESLSMARVAADDGTTDIVATPHSNHQYRFQPEIVAERTAELNALCSGFLRIHNGCDFHLHFENIEDTLRNPGRYTINNLNYLMVEFADLTIPPNITDIFQRMQQAGITPVITHPERNPVLQRNQSMMDPWLERGVCLQITAQSLTGHFGRTAGDMAWRIVEGGRAQFVASDAHDPNFRPPTLKTAYDQVYARCGAELARALFIDNPAATLRGEFLPSPDHQSERKKTNGWRRFFR